MNCSVEQLSTFLSMKFHCAGQNSTGTLYAIRTVPENTVVLPRASLAVVVLVETPRG